MTGTDDGEFYSHSGDPGYSGLADDEEEAAVEDPEFLQVQAETSTELPVGDEAFGDWAEPEPKELRGFFGRGRHGRGEDVNVDDSTEVVWDDDPVGIAASEVPADFLDTDQAAPPDFGGLFEPITEESILATEVPSVESIPLEQPKPTDVFDIDEPELVQRPQPQPQLLRDGGVAVPEGYERWQEAVEDAIELGTGVDACVDEHTDEDELQAPRDVYPVTNELPAGFEAFPGTTDVEVFDLPVETMRHEMEGDGLDGAWTIDSVDADQMLNEEMDIPFPVGGDELEEQIYSGPGTIEHRDLAAAVAEGSDDDTQWQAISAAMPGVETGVLGFEDVADLGTGGEYVAPAQSDIRTRVITGLVLIALLIGSLYVAEEVFVGFVCLVVILGLVEFYGSLRRSGYLPLSLFGIVAGVGTLVATWFHGPVAILVGVLLTSTVTFFFYAFSQTRKDALPNAGLTVLGVGWVVATVAFVIPIARSEEQVILILAIVTVTAATDVGAFAFGRMWGRSPLAPILSPNKTTEGLAGGVMLSLVVAGAFGFLELGPFDLNSGLALGVIVAFLTPIGDLSESMIKRSLGIKDMGFILPGHGGVLDRIDAFLFVIPAAWVLYETIGYLG